MDKNWTTIGSLEDIPLDDVTVVAADVDHTLFDFDLGHAAAVDEIRSAFSVRLGDALEDMFQLVLQGSRVPEGEAWNERQDFAALMTEIAAFQPWTDPEHPRKWARASWMQVINEREKLGMTAADIARASDAYWKTLGSSGGIYPDARMFLRRLDLRRIPLVLMTASDSVLKQDGENFVYNDVFSYRAKMRRLGLLDIAYTHAVVGELHDKPSPEFYDMVDDAVYHAGGTDFTRAIAVGDSLRGDVLPPAERGYRAFHLKRK